jgi:hypothetical protein
MGAAAIEDLTELANIVVGAKTTAKTAYDLWWSRSTNESIVIQHNANDEETGRQRPSQWMIIGFLV